MRNPNISIKRLLTLEPGQVQMQVIDTDGNAHYFIVHEDQYQRLLTDEENIQDIFPNIPAEQRELLITGYSPSQWNNMFGEEESFFS